MEIVLEIWKEIPEYEGFYSVSNFGLVKSHKRNSILKNIIASNGYMVLSLYKNRVKKQFTIHVLVAMAFLEHKQDGHNNVIDHIDNDKLNNHVSNLQITTHRHNCSKDKVAGTSEYTGVSWKESHKKWLSRIWIEGKSIHLGYYDSEELARDEYKKALDKYGF